ncbi:MAG TPA: hypothetical protein PKD54_15310 [Pirellulaceae bacterium]|nr:hypothetical protein [Pirellulaceae bacterium]
MAVAISRSSERAICVTVPPELQTMRRESLAPLLVPASEVVMQLAQFYNAMSPKAQYVPFPPGADWPLRNPGDLQLRRAYRSPHRYAVQWVPVVFFT